MKLVKPHYDIWIQKPGLDGVYKAIERAGRICYKSDDKITEDSAKPFVDRLINSNHLSVLEHGSIYLTIPTEEKLFSNSCDPFLDSPYDDFLNSPYTNIYCQNGYFYISTNYRTVIENVSPEFISELLQYRCEPTEFHRKRITVHFILSRSIAQEFTRHRKFSFSMESQRYCNYSKNKFGNEVTFIIPNWLNLLEGSYTYEYPKGFTIDGDPWQSELKYNNFLLSLVRDEASYFQLLQDGWKPQQAREVLPNACKTELVMTGFISDWNHFFELRDDSKAHPQAQELAKPLHEEFIARGYDTEK